MKKTMAAATLVLLLTTSMALAQEGRRVALVIGNSSYQSVPVLANPKNDAVDMSAALAGIGFEVITVTDGTYAQMIDAVERFRRSLSGAGMGLFYYAGHGVQSQGSNYLLPVDANITAEYQLKAMALDAGLVLEAMEMAGVGLNVVILDACRNNPFPGSGRSVGGGRGLSVMGSELKGVLIAYATDPGKEAQDGTGRNGVYTGALLRHLATPGIDIKEMLDRVGADVAAMTNGAQTPWYNSKFYGKYAMAGAMATPATFATSLAVPPSVGTPSGSSEPVMIGGIGPVSGAAATFGVSARRGCELAVEEWNAAGGVLGRPIKLVFADDTGDPTAGADAWTRLIEEDKVVGIVGAVTSPVSLAGAPISQRLGVPTISPTATNVKVTGVGDYIFRACFVDSFQGTVGAKFAYDNLGARTAAAIFDGKNEYARGLSEFFRTKFEALGGRVVAFEAHPAGTGDFTALLTRIVKAGPDVIYIPDYYGDAASIAKQLRALGYTGPLVGGDGWDSPELIALGGAAMENGFFTSAFSKDATRQEVRAFVARFKARFGGDPDSLAALAYDATYLLLSGIKAAGSLEGPKVKAAIAALDLGVVTGWIEFDAGRNPLKSAVIIEIKGGRQVYRTTVDP